MRNIFFFILLLAMTSCHKTEIGYLKTTGASYLPNTLTIRTVLDPVLDQARITNKAPWVSNQIQGVLGTPPINYRITGVKATDGGNATVFLEELKIRGNGVMQVPLTPKSPQGQYTVSIEIYNEDHSQRLDNVFTFIIQ